MTLNTQGYGLTENQRLSEELNSKFGLNSRVAQIRGKYFVINIPSANAELLANLIRPYLIPTMLYKLPRILKMKKRHSLSCLVRGRSIV